MKKILFIAIAILLSSCKKEVEETNQSSFMIYYSPYENPKDYTVSVIITKENRGVLLNISDYQPSYSYLKSLHSIQKGDRITIKYRCSKIGGKAYIDLVNNGQILMSIKGLTFYKDYQEITFTVQ